MEGYYRLVSGYLFLEDENVLLDSENRQIRKYNEAGSKIIGMLDSNVMSIEQIQVSLEESHSIEWGKTPIIEFMQILIENNIVEECIEDE